MMPCYPVSSIIPELTVIELLMMIEACSHAIRLNQSLAMALKELNFTTRIYELQDDNGDYNPDFDHVVEEINLAILANICSARLIELLVKNQSL